MTTKSFAAALWSLVICTQTVLAEDWPQWGGPDRNHVSKETGLLQHWPSGGPKRVWLFREAGLGYSAAAVSKDRLYILGDRKETEHLIALNAADGKELWAAEIDPALKNNWGDGPRGTPCVSGEQVFALGGQGTLVAVNLADGQVQWKKKMQALRGKIPTWGFTESVYVSGDTVYCTPGGDKGSIAALDRKTGELKWQSSEITEPAQYSSIVPAKINGEDQLVQLTMRASFAVNAKDGKLLWKSDWPGRTAVIPTPIVRDNYVYLTAGYGVGCDLLKIGPDNKVEHVYSDDAKKVMKNHHGGVVLVGNHLFGYSDGPGWVCQDFLSGKEVWAAKKLGKGAVTYADKRLYCLEEDSGTVALVEASDKGWQEHGRFKLDPQTEQRSPSGKIWTHPVIANGKLYLRDQELLFCFDIAAK